MIPANIRWALYPKREDVKLENKFTAIPLKIPLCPDMPSAYKEIQKVTKILKSNFFTVYAQYALTYIF